MRRRDGFTLVEVLVALAILAVGLLAVAKMTYMAVRANVRNQQAGSGVVAAQSKMEQLRGYARSDRADKFSPLDFDYLVSKQAKFASLLKPGTPPTDFVIDGLLSGGPGGGTAKVAPWAPDDLVFDVLYDDGSNGDEAAGDGIYTMEDPEPVQSQGLAKPFWVRRKWTVEPITDPVTDETNFARLTVNTRWTDQNNVEKEVTLTSLVHRRQ
jgi:prepilin-type N-terminal cleavage/methylation domain-containing protein